MSTKDLMMFFQDPRWPEMEELILSYIEPLTDMKTLDLKQPAEHVKAEILGRIYAHEALQRFLEDSKILNKPQTEKSSFR